MLGGAGAGALWGNGIGSVGTALWLALVAVLVVAAPVRRDRVRTASAVAAVVFAGYLALRASPWLIPLNLAASFGLVAFAAVVPSDRSILQRPARVIARFLGLFRLGRAALYVARPMVALVGAQDRGRARSVLVGLGLAVPLVAVIGSLLAAGDAVFSAALERFAYVDGTITIGWYVGLGALVTTTLMLATSRTWTPSGEIHRPLGPVEATIVAGAIALLYGAFAISQAVATFGGVDQVLETAGLTRAEYARAGFFQLLWAAGLTLAALLVLDRVRRRDGGVAFRGLAVVSSLLTVLVVAVSMNRLLAYVGDFGWTMLRLYTVVFAAWIGLLFLGLAARFAGLRVLEDWYPVFVAVTGLVWLLGVNVLDPEAFVARENLSDPSVADASYLVELSPDATPAILDGLDGLSPRDQAFVLQELCEDTDAAWLGNLGRMRAFDAVQPRC